MCVFVVVVGGGGSGGGCGGGSLVGWLVDWLAGGFCLVFYFYY